MIELLGTHNVAVQSSDLAVDLPLSLRIDSKRYSRCSHCIEMKVLVSTKPRSPTGSSSDAAIRIPLPIEDPRLVHG